MANASSQDRTGDGVGNGNLSRDQKRVQAAAAAAYIYQKSFVYPSPSSLTWYALYVFTNMFNSIWCLALMLP